jgi:hypothetical protein
MKSVAFAAALALAAPAGLASPVAAQPAPAAAAPAPAAPAEPAPAAAPPAPAAAPAAPGPCAGARSLNFICGMINVEDLVSVDGGKELVGSSYKEGPVGLYVIDVASKTAKAAVLSVAAKPDPVYGCPGAPDLTKLSTHGLDARPGPNGTATVYAVSHGQRESIEVFHVDARKGTAEWIGCVIAPPNATLNSVVGLRDGSVVFTKFLDPNDKNGIQTVMSGQVNGVVYHWVPGKGTSEVPNTQLSGDNGLLASPDGRTLYVNAYGTKEVWKVSLNGKDKPVKAKVEFNPDNLRWGDNGQILVTGQFRNPDKPGPTDWGVARLDPETMFATSILTAPGMPEFDNATTAVKAGNMLWLGTFRGDRIAYMPAP